MQHVFNVVFHGEAATVQAAMCVDGLATPCRMRRGRGDEVVAQGVPFKAIPERKKFKTSERKVQ